ncbi:MAG: tripartite tricarboxylate transporter permease, partial [Planctomycetales bacterium]
AVNDILFIDQKAESVPMSRKGMYMKAEDWKRQSANLSLSSLIGTWVGILPGIGANIGSVMAYTAAKGMSKEPEQFGHGSEDGVVASEAANNATVGGALIPLISMGIPGSVIDAILLGALVIHGLQPGPLLFEQKPDLVYVIMASVLAANCFMFLFMVASVGVLSKLMYVPRAHLLPVVLVFCVVGSFALSNRMFDVWVMLAFGAIGLLMDKTGIPLAPFVIGFVLTPVGEKHLVAGLMLHKGSYTQIAGLTMQDGGVSVTSPFALLFCAIALVMLVWPIWKRWREWREE